MVHLFILVFFSSVVTGAGSLSYLAIKRLFQKFFTLNFTLKMKTRAFHLMILMQPVLIFLTVVVILLGTYFQKEGLTSARSTRTDFPNSAYVVITEDDSADLINKQSASTFGMIHPTLWIRYISYLSYAWGGITILLLIIKAMRYAGFKHFLTKGGLRLVRYADTKPLIYVSKSISSPFLIGFFRPCIMIPHVNLDDFELSLIIKHENVHFKNRDFQFKVLLAVLKCINWFNPIFGIIQKKFNDATEIIADAAVTKNLSTSHRRTYGMLILKFAEHGRKSKNNMKCPSFYSYLSEDTKSLTDRLEFIMKNNKEKSTNRQW